MLDRLARAVHLECERIGNGAWQVTGGANAHVVGEDASSCDCFDYAHHRAPCKHVLAVRLRLGDPEALRALRALIPAPQRAPRRRSLPMNPEQALTGNPPRRITVSPFVPKPASNPPT